MVRGPLANPRACPADDVRAGRFPAEKLTRVQALKGMTYDAAYASFAEDRLGSLAPGKKADFVVLDRDIMTVPQEQILGTKVVSTVSSPCAFSSCGTHSEAIQVIDGQIAYGRLRVK
jgi:predicted amidohydrolase YtcJ